MMTTLERNQISLNVFQIIPNHQSSDAFCNSKRPMLSIFTELIAQDKINSVKT